MTFIYEPDQIRVPWRHRLKMNILSKVIVLRTLTYEYTQTDIQLESRRKKSTTLFRACCKKIFLIEIPKWSISTSHPVSHRRARSAQYNTVGLGAFAVFICRSSVADVSTHKVAESAAVAASVSSRALHHSVAGGRSVINQPFNQLLAESLFQFYSDLGRPTLLNVPSSDTPWITLFKG